MGVRNHGAFMSFLFFIMVTLITIIVTIALNFYDYYEITNIEDTPMSYLLIFPDYVYSEALYIASAVIVIGVCGFFILPVL